MTTKLVPFVILILAVLGCSRFGQLANSSNPTKPARSDPSAFTLAGKEWSSRDLDQTDITVDLPGETKDKTPPESMFPPGTKQVFHSMKIHAYDERDFQSSYTQFVPTGKKALTIKDLGETNMVAVKKQIRDLSSTIDVVSPTKAKYNGTFTRNGKVFDLKGCCIMKKDNPARIWSVMTIYPSDNADARTASDRIIQSATFKGSAEECE